MNEPTECRKAGRHLGLLGNVCTVCGWIRPAYDGPARFVATGRKRRRV